MLQKSSSAHRMRAYYHSFLPVQMECHIFYAANSCQRSDARPESVQDMDVLITKWNRHYFMTVDFIHQFNRCFGCLLLVLIAPVFIRVISALHLL
jgi:hypothetical protein